MLSICSAVRSMNGRFWRDSSSEVGPSRRSIAAIQAIAVSVVSQGRQTSMCGM